MKSKSFYEKQLNNLIKLTSKKHPEILTRNIDIDKYCSKTRYRCQINWRIRHFSKYRKTMIEYRNSHREYIQKKWREYYYRNREQCIERARLWNTSHVERVREIERRRRERNPLRSSINFARWKLNNPRRAQLCAAASAIATAAITKLWIRPTVCPHCGRSNCNIDFHHPNHLFWWKWTFCCKSCHYFFNRDKVPASDTIIDLKKLLRESNSH